MSVLILASTSPYRKELLSRLGVPFEAVNPDYDEPGDPALSAKELATLHALKKAESLVCRYPASIIIGSDQTAEVDGEILGKPGSPEGAVMQLARMSGRTVHFHTGLAVVRGGEKLVACERFDVTLRALTPAEIGAYVEREMPVNCAGSFMIEGLGIALMESLAGDDYTSLIGLPLLRLTKMLRLLGFDVLTQARSVRSSCR